LSLTSKIKHACRRDYTRLRLEFAHLYYNGLKQCLKKPKGDTGFTVSPFYLATLKIC
jgi:hypothetical protein